MGGIGQLRKRPDILHIAQCLAAACFAGLVLTIDTLPARADLAPIPQTMLDVEPAPPHQGDRAAAAPATADFRGLPVVKVSVVSKTLELSQLAPEAFGDWDGPPR